MKHLTLLAFNEDRQEPMGAFASLFDIAVECTFQQVQTVGIMGWDSVGAEMIQIVLKTDKLWERVNLERTTTHDQIKSPIPED
jgi:hypothetical protein